MIGEMGWLRKTKTTNPPVVLEVNGVVSMKQIDMYIDHESSVGGCFSKRSRIALARRHVVIFPRSPRDGGLVTISF